MEFYISLIESIQDKFIFGTLFRKGSNKNRCTKGYRHRTPQTENGNGGSFIIDGGKEVSLIVIPRDLVKKRFFMKQYTGIRQCGDGAEGLSWKKCKWGIGLCIDVGN